MHPSVRFTILFGAGRPDQKSYQKRPRKEQEGAEKYVGELPVPAAENSGISVEVQKRIAAFKSRPIPATEVKIFHYDPEQPLQISSPQSGKKPGE